MGKHKFKDITGSRGVRVNTFKDDTEQDIHLRLIRAITDEYFEDHAPDVVDSPVKGEHGASQEASPPPPLLELDEILYELRLSTISDFIHTAKGTLPPSYEDENIAKAKSSITALLNSKLIEELERLSNKADDYGTIYGVTNREIVNRIDELKQGDQS